jgi:hypothetical protein
MRKIVTLDPDIEALIRKRMRERGTSFRQTLNDAIREGLAGGRGDPGFRTTTANLGMPSVNLDRAVQLAAELEDVEVISKMRGGK